MPATTRDSGWLRCFRPRPDARIQLFCFPHAGAGATVYSSWPQYLTEDIELYGVQLPGREDRADETALTCVEPLMASIIPELQKQVRGPFALFGHSMGALLAFEAARRAEDTWLHGPRLLSVSGFPAPDRRGHGPSMQSLSDEQLLAWFAQFGRSRTDLGDQLIRAAALPILRADVAVCESYTYARRPPLRCPVSVFAGAADASVTAAELARWGHHTAGSFNTRVLPGGHYFVDTSRRDLLGALGHELVACLD